MPSYLVTANFNVEADTEEEAEEIFEDYLADSTILTDTKFVAFECIESVMKDNEDENDDNTASYACYGSQADGYVEGPDATLRNDLLETYDETKAA